MFRAACRQFGYSLIPFDPAAAFFDAGVGLVGRFAPLQAPLELAGKGVLAEQFVGQQLLSAKPKYINPELYYWHPPRAEA